MKRSLTALAAGTLLLMLTGCGQVQDAANKAVNDGATAVATAAAGEVTKQVCALVEDGLVSIKDKELLGGLVGGAEAAGVPVEITSELREIAQSGDEVPAESVTALREACSA